MQPAGEKRLRIISSVLVAIGANNTIRRRAPSPGRRYGVNK